MQFREMQRNLTTSLGSPPDDIESVTFVFLKVESLETRRHRPDRFDKKEPFFDKKEPPKDFEKKEDKKDPPKDFEKDPPKEDKRPDLDVGFTGKKAEDDKSEKKGRFDEKKEPDKKGFEEKPPRDEHEEDFSSGPDLIIVRSAMPYDKDKVLSAVLGEPATAKHKGKTYYVAGKGGIRFGANADAAVFLVNKRTYLIASTKGRMKKVLEATGEKKDGPLTTALALAEKKHQSVLGLNLTEKSGRAWKARLIDESRSPFFRETDALAIQTLLPVLDLQQAALALDLANEKAKAVSTLIFADKKKAAAAMDAVKDALVLLRLFQVGSWKMSLSRQFEDLDDPREIQSGLFMMGLVDTLAKMLREAQVESQGANIRVQLQAPFNLKEAMARAEKERQALLKDEDYLLSKRHRIITNNLKQIALSLHAHNDVFKFIPAAAFCSKKDGKPLLSWRVAILPFIEEDVLYRQFKLDEPWDSPHNIKLLPEMPKIYAPVGKKPKEPHSTYIQAFVGKGTAFELVPDMKFFFGAKGMSIPRDFRDGTSNTIAVVEAAEAIPWTKPGDLPYDAKKPLPKLGGQFPGGFHAALMDGSVAFVSSKIDEETLRAMITRSGGEVVNWDKYVLRRPGVR
jgi:nitrous oxide reductase accessory protein NosL